MARTIVSIFLLPSFCALYTFSCYLLGKVKRKNRPSIANSMLNYALLHCIRFTLCYIEISLQCDKERTFFFFFNAKCEKNRNNERTWRNEMGSEIQIGWMRSALVWREDTLQPHLIRLFDCKCHAAIWRLLQGANMHRFNWKRSATSLETEQRRARLLFVLNIKIANCSCLVWVHRINTKIQPNHFTCSARVHRNRHFFRCSFLMFTFWLLLLRLLTNSRPVQF